MYWNSSTHRNAEVVSDLMSREQREGQGQGVTTRFTSLAWGIDRIDSRALPLDGRTRQAHTGVGVPIYVIDTGTEALHDEFI